MENKPRFIILAYGSLKKGFWNHDRYFGKAKFLGESKLIGAMQLAPGRYPYLFEAGTVPEADKEHTVEAYEVEENIYNLVREMEENSGYYTKMVETEFGEATVFYAQTNMLNKNKEFIEAYTVDAIK